tara:strand:- start:968 stop:2011 length:1044 start_codon:yes stop_codon:yes gene_type:complete
VDNRYLLIFTSNLLFLIFFGCESNLDKDFVVKGSTMGTQYQIVVRHSKEINTDLIFKDVSLILEDINNQMSTYDSNSEISIFNSTKELNQPYQISDYFAEVIKKSFYYNEISEGFFDITVKPLYQLWGFQGYNARQYEPSENILRSFFQFVGMDNIVFDFNRKTIYKRHAETEIDVSAIAKGYAVDIVADYLSKKGYLNYYVEIGGEIKVKTSHQKGWLIGIQDPNELMNSVDSVYLLNGAIATSGNYFNFIEYLGKKSKKRTHIINPIDGYPLEIKEGVVASATVISKDCIDADALATILMILSINDAIDFIESIENSEAYIIYYDQGELKSAETSNFSNFKNKFN